MVKGAALFVTLAAAGCEPALDQTTSLVSSPRVLAVQAIPAEAAPGAKVRLTALFVDASGSLAHGPFDWAFCDARNPLANLGPVSPLCTQTSGSSFIELGTSATLTSPLPLDACRQFGPDVPSAQPGEPPGRPVDPDATGGYYEPVRLVAGSEVAVGLLRITCDVPGASPEQLTTLAAEDHPNTNPGIDGVVDSVLGTLSVAVPNAVHVGQRLDLRATWQPCEPAATTCTGSEGYAYLDALTHDVVQAREQMRVSWFATAGAFDSDRTGRAASDPTAYSENGWVAPASPAEVHLWVVLRDDRGGVGWRSYTLTVS